VNLLYLGHVTAFALAALACFGSVRRVRDVEHPGTRRGLTALLVSSGIWAGSHVGYLLFPSPSGKRAFYVLGLVVGLVTVGAWLYFSAAYTGRSVRQLPYRRLVVGVLLVFIGLKVTNPLHHQYFTAEMVATPFPHLAVQHSTLHWMALGLAYALSFVGFYMLLEHFHHAGTDTRPFAALVGLTALPIGGNIAGALSPWLLAMTYEPIGVAAFALGVLFVYFDRFQAVHLAGEIDEPVVFLDQNDRIRDYNRTASDLFPALSGSTGRSVETVLPNLVDRGGDASGVVELTRDGETRYVRIASNPFMAGETQTGRSLVVSDVTEAERYRRELERKTEQLEALNRIVRHDIRNDMSVVLGWGETLEEHVDEAGTDTLDRILRTAQHTVELTRTAGDFVESLTDEEQLELKTLDLRSHLVTELDTCRNTYPEAEFHVPENLPSVPVRAHEMLSSVFRNLLNNAVQHNDAETPEVTVSVDDRGETVAVRIADNGPGIPDERKEKIFGKGERGLRSEGTGIGLYLVQTLVDQLNGSARVEDNEPEGAAFVVELPKAAA
jgi:signal transduction histidine kinase